MSASTQPSRTKSRSSRDQAIASRARPRPCSSTSAGCRVAQDHRAARPSSARRASSTASSRTRSSRSRSRTPSSTTTTFNEDARGRDRRSRGRFEDPVGRGQGDQGVPQGRDDRRRSSTIKCGVLESQVMPGDAGRERARDHARQGRAPRDAARAAAWLRPRSWCMQLQAPARTSPSRSMRAGVSSKDRSQLVNDQQQLRLPKAAG